MAGRAQGLLPSLIATAALSLSSAACGSGSRGGQVAQLGSSGTATESRAVAATDKFAASLAYSRCMRSHGIYGFPDPKQVGDEIEIPGAQSGMNPQSPLFESAQRSCAHLSPGGDRQSRADQQEMLARILHVSQCMRSHGIPGFPDPTLTSPSDRAHFGAIMSNDGVWLAIPVSIDVQSPAFEHAAAACKLS